MKSLSAITRPKRLDRCVTRTLLLALPFGGIALPLSPVQAQPALPGPTKKSAMPLSPEQKARVEMLLAISRQEKQCKKRIDFRIDGGTLEDVIARVKALFPAGAFTVEVRGATPVRVSFDSKETSVGNVLHNVAALAGCQLFLRHNGLLTAPTSQLSEAEILAFKDGYGGSWGKNTGSGGSGWSMSMQATDLFTHAVAQEATGSAADHLTAGVVKTNFGNFSPESQAMLRDLNSWASEGAASLNPNLLVLPLDPTSQVTVDTSRPNAVSVRFPLGLSNPGGMSIGITNMNVNVPANPDPQP